MRRPIMLTSISQLLQTNSNNHFDPQLSLATSPVFIHTKESVNEQFESVLFAVYKKICMQCDVCVCVSISGQILLCC